MTKYPRNTYQLYICGSVQLCWRLVWGLGIHENRWKVKKRLQTWRFSKISLKHFTSIRVGLRPPAMTIWPTNIIAEWRGEKRKEKKRRKEGRKQELERKWRKWRRRKNPSSHSDDDGDQAQDQSSANPGSFAATGGNFWSQTKAELAKQLILLPLAEYSNYSTSLPRGLWEDDQDHADARTRTTPLTREPWSPNIKRRRPRSPQKEMQVMICCRAMAAQALVNG